MGKSSFELDNPDAVSDLLKEADRASGEDALRQGAAQAATVFKDEMVSLVRRRSGQLAASITVAYLPEESVTGRVATYLATPVGVREDLANGKPGMRNKDVANWLEYGTSKMAAEPFIRPALETKIEEAANAALDRIEEVMTSG